MKPFIILILTAFLQGAPATAQTPMVGVDPRLQTIPYDSGRVVPLRVAPGFQLTVIFGADERVENVAIGDSEAWQVTLNNRGDSLFLKPIRSGGVTNMTVITDARVYNFELASTQGSTADTPFTVRFLYPESEKPPELAPQPGVGRYRLSGSRTLRPSAIDDDGIRTFIEWRASQALPAIFALDEQGNEILLDGHIRDGRYVIDSVHRILLFKLDRQTARAARLPPRSER